MMEATSLRFAKSTAPQNLWIWWYHGVEHRVVAECQIFEAPNVISGLVLRTDLQKDSTEQRRGEVISERPQDMAGNWLNTLFYFLLLKTKDLLMKHVVKCLLSIDTPHKASIGRPCAIYSYMSLLTHLCDVSCLHYTVFVTADRHSSLHLSILLQTSWCAWNQWMATVAASCHRNKPKNWIWNIGRGLVVMFAWKLLIMCIFVTLAAIFSPALFHLSSLFWLCF